MESRQLLGREVVGAGGFRIGRVKEIRFDEGTWRIESLDVELDRAVAEEFEMKRLLVRTTLNVGVSSVKAVGDHVLLSVTKPQLRDLVTSPEGGSKAGEGPGSGARP